MICFAPDDYLEELQVDRGQAIWIAKLSDGRDVFSDDWRPGLTPWNAWERLNTFCRESGLHVTDLSLKFRRERRQMILPHDAEGYFFCHGLIKDLVTRRKIRFMTLGFVKDQEVETQKWLVPELQLLNFGSRPLSQCPPECVIMRP